MTRFLLTGCSGGGKSTLIEALANEGVVTVPEPGRRVIAAAEAADQTTDRDAVPWQNLTAFLRHALDMAHPDLVRTNTIDSPVIFDRGVLDAAVALRHHDGTSLNHSFRGAFPYTKTVFVAPDWPELFQNDQGRRHSLQEAQAEYQRISAALDQLGLEAITLPKTSVADRLRFVMNIVKSRS
ncbi:AAA family ATPase [Phaeobacter sp.]|uniref:AAA family ATPase n=1 Tax=Phaeobacter sp. TaxID=1902409 RepID=UPI0025F2D23D|nr:AAA family ATPase [Phaeobacter sp.]